MINVGLVTGVQDVTHISPALYQLIQSVTFILHALILLIEKNICIYVPLGQKASSILVKHSHVLVQCYRVKCRVIRIDMSIHSLSIYYRCWFYSSETVGFIICSSKIIGHMYCHSCFLAGHTHRSHNYHINTTS